MSCKLKLCNYKPGHALGLQDIEASRIFRHLAHEGGRVVSPSHWPPLPQGDIPGTQFLLDAEQIPEPQWWKD